MSWKRLLTAGFAVCVLSSSVMAAPSILAKPRPYAFATQATGGIQWEIFVTQHDPLYTGALSVELPLSLTQVSGPGGSAAVIFPQSLGDAAGDDTNGGAQATWYYNETADASGSLLWNITDPAAPLDHTQNVGLNPFTGLNAEGLVIDTAGKRVFAALGSTIALPDALSALAGKQVRIARVFSTDGVMNWTNAIIGENGVQYTGISGSQLSIAPGDTNGSGTMNPTTGAVFDPTNNADITDFRTLLAPGGLAVYNAAHPGLNGAKRGDYNNSGTTNNADITAFRASLTNPAGGSGLGGGTTVPEPTSLVLLMIGGCTACVWRRRRSK
jgi:hypothetical protein